MAIPFGISICSTHTHNDLYFASFPTITIIQKKKRAPAERKECTNKPMDGRVGGYIGVLKLNTTAAAGAECVCVRFHIDFKSAFIKFLSPSRLKEFIESPLYRLILYVLHCVMSYDVFKLM